MRIIDQTGRHDGIEAVVCIGVFDGVHLGHQDVIGRSVERARELGTESAVVTFDRDPELVLVPEQHIPQICTLDQKTRLIGRLNPDCLLVLPFDSAMARLRPEQFLLEHLLTAFVPKMVVVGENFRFGAGGAGDVRLLERFGLAHDFEVEGLPLLEIGDEPVSSTRIRALLVDGDVAGAADLLGHAFAVQGPVVAGAGRGRDLGYHTANIAVPGELAIPRTGVYAGAATVEGTPRPAAVNVGSRPTFEPDGKVWVEVHIIGFDGDLYGATVEISFLDRLRDEMRFENAAELRRRIGDDVEQARRAFDVCYNPRDNL